MASNLEGRNEVIECDGDLLLILMLDELTIQKCVQFASLGIVSSHKR
jgi:hypothetical protein